MSSNPVSDDKSATSQKFGNLLHNTVKLHTCIWCVELIVTVNIENGILYWCIQNVLLHVWFRVNVVIF